MFDSTVPQDFVPLEVEREHLTRSEATLLDDAIVVQLDGPDFGAGDDQSLFGHFVAARSQPVAVQRGANEAAV